MHSELFEAWVLWKRRFSQQQKLNVIYAPNLAEVLKNAK
jgi:hypothetical protein